TGSNGSGSMTFTGSLTNVNNALNNLVYTPAANYNGPDTLSLTTKNTLDGLTTSSTVSITVTPVDDAPTNTVPAAQNVNENTNLVLTGATAISIVDIDAGMGYMAVKLTVSHGILSVGGDASGLATLLGDGTATVNLTGTVSAINTALSTLTYSPATNSTLPDTLTVFTDDQGNTGTGGPLTATSTVNITVNPFNDVPVNAVPGQQTNNEDTARIFSAGNGNQISIADGDIGAGIAKVTLSVLHGTLTVGGNT